MRHFIKILVFLSVFALGNLHLSAQNIVDDQLSFENLEKKIDSLQHDSVQALTLIKFYIKKSKKEGNKEFLFYAYRYASMYYPTPTNFKYADSALVVAKKSAKTQLIAEAYLNRGTIYMDKGYYQRALDEILRANKLSLDLKDDYFIHKTIYYIAQNKIYLGNYEDANKELKTCIDYFKKNLRDKTSLGQNSQTYYIYSLISYLDTNTKTGKQNENRALISEAKTYLKENKLDSFIPYFISIEGTDAYYRKEYGTAIQKLTEALKLYNNQWSHNTEVYYLGLAHWRLGNHAAAIKYLEEIDKEYEENKKLDPQFRSAYELLIKYSDSAGNKKKQLEYINKLMTLDRSYEKNYKYLFSKINKEYDTQKLIAEKNRIEKSLQRSYYLAAFLLLLISIVAFYGYRFYKNQKKYKAKFDEIYTAKFNQDGTPKQPVTEQLPLHDVHEDTDLEYYNKIPGLKPTYVQEMLLKLDQFEQEKQFTNPQLSLKCLSETFETNYVYLSKIINEYRGNNFNFYINDLRLEYAVELLKQKKYLYMDIKDLAALSGFATANAFSTNFMRKYEMKPSHFIKLLKQNA